MKRFMMGLITVLLSFAWTAPAVWADGRGDGDKAEAETLPDAVRVTLIRLGGIERVHTVSGGSRESECHWTSGPAEISAPGDTTTIALGDAPSDRSVLYVLLCNGDYYSTVWVSPEDIVDLDALAAAEAQRYVEEVLRPDIAIGVNPAARGLAGLRSWFWVEGFTGSVTAPPIAAFGMTIDVRMSSSSVTWDFGDGTVVAGDLGQAYPAESSVQHAHRSAGGYEVTASIELAPEYRIDGGPWLGLPPLITEASVDHAVEQRQAVIIDA